MGGGCIRRVWSYEITVIGSWRKIEVYISGLYDSHFYQMGPVNRPTYNDKVMAWTVRGLIPDRKKTLSHEKKCPDQL